MHRHVGEIALYDLRYWQLYCTCHHRGVSLNVKYDAERVLNHHKYRVQRVQELHTRHNPETSFDTFRTNGVLQHRRIFSELYNWSGHLLFLAVHRCPRSALCCLLHQLFRRCSWLNGMITNI